jgi:Electron transfer DM13
MSKNIPYLLTGAGLLIIGATAYFTPIIQSNLENKDIQSREVPQETITEKDQSNISSKNEKELLKSGKFINIDPLHGATGDVKLFKTNGQVLIELQDNFKSKTGPDLYLRLVQKQDIKNTTSGIKFTKDNFINLGKLNKTTGGQVYKVSIQEFEKNNYALVIYCNAFKIQFSNAILN